MSDEYDAEKWESDEALEFLKMERDVHPEEDNEALTRRLLMEAAPGAALSIIQLSRTAGNDNTRFNASKYIVDFVREIDGGEETWEHLLPEFVEKAENFANSSSPEE